MRLHGNAKLTPFQQNLLCVRVRDEGWTVEDPLRLRAVRNAPPIGGWLATTRVNR